MAYQVAETLHKTLGEVLEMPVEEFNGWVAYFKEKAKNRGKR